jgi:iron complex outermembrane receptor protein
LLRPLVGIRGSLFSGWHYEATAYLSQDRLHYELPTTNLPNVLNALASSDPATALNPFTTGAAGTSQLLQSLEAIDPNNSYRAKLVDRIANAQGLLRGSLFSLPAGPVQAAFGGEYGQEKQDTDAGYPPIVRTVLQRKTYAVFTEARVPLLAERGSQSGERLALTLAGRYDHSDDFGGKATWQTGLLWRASDTLSFSSGYGVSYRAPTLPEIANPQVSFTGDTGTVDPFRNNLPLSPAVTIVYGPNANLNPETGDALTLGLTYSSEALRGLRASIIYYDLKISNYISSHTFQDLIDYPGLFPGAVIRAPATAQDQQQGFLGQIVQINNIPQNFGDLQVAGFDGDLSYAIDSGIGRLTPSLALANIYKWQSALTPNSPAIGYVSQAVNTLAGGTGWAPRWKGTAALAWQRGPLSLNLAGRYIGRYKDYQIIVPNSNELGNAWFLDLNARFEAGQTLASTGSWLAGTYLAVGAVDLLDKTPPFSYGGIPYDPSQYDIRGRFIYANVGLMF